MATRYRTFSVRVRRVTSLTPHFVRVTLTGDELAEFSAVGLDQRIKIVLPLPGHGYTEIPDDGSDWFTAWRELPDELRNPIRTYTVRAFRPDDHELDIDFVDHGEMGPASRWVTRATVGDELMIVGPVVPESPADLPIGAAEFALGAANRVMIAGDETAAPAICAILEALDARTVGHVFIEVPTAADALPISAPSGVEVVWVPRDGALHGARMTDHVHGWAASYSAARARAAAAVSGAAVSGAAGSGAAVSASDGFVDVDVDRDILWDIPGSANGDDVYAWIAGEAGCVKEIRRHLVRGVGIDRRSVAFMGYWRQGKAEG